MKATDLMIGDYINRNDIGIRRVVIIDASKNTIETPTSFFGDVPNVTSCNNIEPIPLTEEILKANGFEMLVFSPELYSTFELSQYNIYFSINDGNGVGVQKADRLGRTYLYFCVDTVHMLQHILRFLGLTDLADNFKVE